MHEMKDTARAVVRIGFDGRVHKTFRGHQARERFEHEVRVLRHLEKRGCTFVPRLLEVDAENLKIVTTNCGGRVDQLNPERQVALFAELESAYQRQAPILPWIYAPHWAPAKYQGEWVEFPEYTKECYTDPAWGSNPDALYDCGKPFGEIWKVGWAGVKDKWPGAYAAIKAFTVDNDEMGQMITRVDLEGKTVSEVVGEWMTANEGRWSEWIKK